MGVRSKMEQLVQIKDWESYCPNARCSPKLNHAFEDEAYQIGEAASEFSLPLFGSAFTSDLRTPSCQEANAVVSENDFLLHVGGSIWALDWCPRRSWPTEHGTKKEFLAVGAHSVSESTHRVGEPVHGKGLIQIWAFMFPSFSVTEGIPSTWKHGSKKKQARRKGAQISSLKGSRKLQPHINLEHQRARSELCGGSSLRIYSESLISEARLEEKQMLLNVESNRFSSPLMVLGLAHDGGVTWDIKWQPSTAFVSTNNDEKVRLGFLAAVFGDGSLQVFDVPMPSVNVYLSVQEKNHINPLVVKMDPVFKSSALLCGGHESIPLCCEWSTWAPYDMLLVGFHDGTVALWKFYAQSSPSENTSSLLCFVADSSPIRAIAWAPDDGGTESRNMVVTGGHTGALRFWDIRDPFRPTWDLVISRGYILSIDWIPNPRCVILSMDDGTLRTLSLNVAANDTPVTRKVCTKTQFQGFHTYVCSSFAIWAVQVSKATGLVAYGGEDGSVKYFQLTEKAVEKESTRYREPHYLCGAFSESSHDAAFFVISQRKHTPVQMKKSSNEWSQTPVSKRGYVASSNLRHVESTKDDADDKCENAKRRRHTSRSLTRSMSLEGHRLQNIKQRRKKCVADVSSALVPVDEEAYEIGSIDPFTFCEEAMLIDDTQLNKRNSSCLALVSIKEDMHVSAEQVVHGLGDKVGESPSSVKAFERLPGEHISVHRIRWNCNKGSERWLSYGGAGGIVRCQLIHSYNL